MGEAPNGRSGAGRSPVIVLTCFLALLGLAVLLLASLLFLAGCLHSFPDDCHITLRAFLFALDTFSVELSTGLTGTILLFVIGSVFGMDVLSYTALAGVGIIVLKPVGTVLRVELLVSMLLSPGLLCFDRVLASLVIARLVVLTFPQTSVHALLAVSLRCFPIFAYRDSFVVVRPRLVLRGVSLSGSGFLLTLLD